MIEANLDRLHPSVPTSEGKQPKEKLQDDLPEWSKDALYARAKEMGIPGRSDMSKTELIEAIRRHR